MTALKAHKGQRDKAGRAYILHPVYVAMQTKGVKRKAVALLHDTIEDTTLTLFDLEKCGFDAEIVQAVDAITKRRGEAYKDYLQRVKSNDIAKDVKLADLKHNSKLSRLKTVTPQDIKRNEKYAAAMAYLRA